MSEVEHHCQRSNRSNTTHCHWSREYTIRASVVAAINSRLAYGLKIKYQQLDHHTNRLSIVAGVNVYPGYRSKVRSQRSGVRGQRSEVRGQRSNTSIRGLMPGCNGQTAHAGRGCLLWLLPIPSQRRKASKTRGH